MREKKEAYSELPGWFNERCEPVVWVRFSEHRGLQEQQFYSFSVVNSIVADLSEQLDWEWNRFDCADSYSAAGTIYYWNRGVVNQYAFSLDLAEGDKSLIDHLRNHMQNDLGVAWWQSYLKAKGIAAEYNAACRDTLTHLVPLLKWHVELSHFAKEAFIYAQKMGRPEIFDWQSSTLKQIASLRESVNQSPDFDQKRLDRLKEQIAAGIKNRVEKDRNAKEESCSKRMPDGCAEKDPALPVKDGRKETQEGNRQPKFTVSREKTLKGDMKVSEKERDFEK